MVVNPRSPRGGAAPDLSVIILALNEGAVLARNIPFLRHLLDEADGLGFRSELIFEEDGSTDDTGSIIDRWAARDARIKALHHPKPLGKGGALVRGVEQSAGRYLLMIDADAPLDVATFLRVLDHLEHGYDVVLPSRRHPESIVQGLPVSRRAASRLFNVLVNAALRLRITDTQCGIKGFRRDVWEKIRPRKLVGFDMDLELLTRARHHDLSIVEIPINYLHTPDRGFKIRRHGLQMLRSIFAARSLNGDQ